MSGLVLGGGSTSASRSAGTHSVAIVNTEASVPEFWMLVFVFLVLESCLKLTQYSLWGQSPDS